MIFSVSEKSERGSIFLKCVRKVNCGGERLKAGTIQVNDDMRELKEL